MELPKVAVQALWNLYDAWMNKVDCYDPGYELLSKAEPWSKPVKLTGISSLIGSEGYAEMDKACDAIEPYEDIIQSYLAEKNIGYDYDYETEGLGGT